MWMFWPFKLSFDVIFSAFFASRTVLTTFYKFCAFFPTFYEQLLRQNPYAKKLQTKIVST
jgi:hypothetical protein